MAAEGVLRSSAAAANRYSSDRAPIFNVATLKIVAAYLVALSATTSIIALSRVAPPQIADPSSFTVSMVGADGKTATGSFVATLKSAAVADDALLNRPEVRAFFWLSGMTFFVSSATLIALLIVGDRGGWSCRVIASAVPVTAMIFLFTAVSVWSGLVCPDFGFSINTSIFIGFVSWVPCVVRFAWLLL